MSNSKNNLLDKLSTASVNAIKRIPENIAISLYKRRNSNFNTPSIAEYAGNNIKEIIQQEHDNFRKGMGVQLNELRRQRQRVNTKKQLPPFLPLGAVMKSNRHYPLSPYSLPSTRSSSPTFSINSPSPSRSRSSTANNVGFSFLNPINKPQLMGGVKRPASPLNNSNRTFKVARYNNNNEFEINVDANVANALKAAIARLQSTRKVRFHNNVNNTIKRKSHFNKVYLPNLLAEGATNEQINLAKTAYKNFMKKEPNEPVYTATAQDAAHKFATFIKNNNTVTYVPEFAYHDLINVFNRINALPYKNATKKMMMKRAYKILAYRQAENENNTLKTRVFLLTPEQATEIRNIMKINSDNWN